jgi:hypothetical protein
MWQDYICLRLLGIEPKVHESAAQSHPKEMCSIRRVHLFGASDSLGLAVHGVWKH